MNEMAVTNLNFFQNELKGFVFKRVKDKALAEDIVQDVFLKVQDKVSQLKDHEKVTAWIYRITQNTIIDHYRKKSKSIDTHSLDWENETPNFNECVTGYLKALLPTLPAIYREALELTELQSISQLELAERLGISYPTARSRVQRARTMLREKMNKALIIETDAYGNAIVCKDRSNCCS